MALGGPVPALLGAWLAAVGLASIGNARLALLVALGVIGAFVAGLVGVGGAIVMIPLLLYVPPLFGFAALPIHTVAGVTMVQVAAAGVAGMLAHGSERRVSAPLVWTLGTGMVGASLIGAALSKFVAAAVLSATFAFLATAAAVVMLGWRHRMPLEGATPSQLNRPLAVVLGTGVGVLVGMVGAGGGFLLMPLMIYALRVPVRVAVGTSLGIVALSGLAGTIGKAATGQVDWTMALALVAGALPGAQFGAFVSQRTRTDVLGLLLGAFIALVAARMWWEILGR